MKLHRNIYVLLFVVTVCLITACSTQRPITAAKLKASSAELFPDVPMTLYYREAQIKYGIAQDSLHYYVAIEAVEPNTCSKILTRGLVISFNTLGKKKQELGIKYPVVTASRPKTESVTLAANPGQNKALVQEQLDNFQELMLFENGESEGGVYPLAMIKGIKVKLTATNFGGLVYQLRISKNRLKLSQNPEKPLGIGVSIESVRTPLGAPTPDGTSMSGGMPAGQSMTQTMNGQQQMMGQQGMMGRPGMGVRQPMSTRMRADSYSQGFNFWVFVK